MEQLVNIGAIVVDPALQPREQMDMAMVMEYAGEMQAGAQFPPVIAFGTVEACWLADGFHRIEAAKLSQLPVYAVDLRPGGRREAQLFSLGANATHGLRRTNADKRRAVETALRDAEWAQWSDREIARHCAVSAPLVAQVRMELGLDHEARKVERGGTVYTMQTEGIGTSATVKPLAMEVFSQAEKETDKPMDDEEVEFGDDYVRRVHDEVAETGQDMATEEWTQGHDDSVEDSVGEGDAGDSFQEVEEVSPIQPTLPAPARQVPVLVPPAQAIPAPKLPAPEKSTPVVVLVARIRGDVADVTVGQEGTMPSIMRKADAERGVLVEVLSQVLADYFNTN